MESSSTSLSPSIIFAHILSLLFFIFFGSKGASGASITIVNDCGFTVWPGISGSPDVNITGFKLTTGTSRSFQAPENWSGRIWGRTGCDSNKSGGWSCTTGDCGTGEIECKGRNYTLPVTIAELNMTNGDDYYDVSLLSGFNLPMTIEVKGGEDYCRVTGCAIDLNRRCPEVLRLEGGGGCRSACQVFPTKDHCCLFEEEEKCNMTLNGIFFLTSCPNAIRYESISPNYPTRCTADDYIVKFCPRADIFSSIKLGDQLSKYDMLVSMNGKINLGFFDYIGGRLGIRYWDGYGYLHLWVTNPNNIVISSSFDQALSIDPNTGNLIITAGGKIITNITDINVGPNPKVTATLEDNGNLRLINEVDKRVLWQSFDYPNGVLMPGMKLGYDLTTGQNVTMTTWMSDIRNPNLGPFTLSWDAPEEASQRLVIHRRGEPYWNSGNLKNQMFEYMPQLTGFKIISVYNNKQRYFSYDRDQDYADQEVYLPPWILTREGRIVIGSTFLTPEFCYGIKTRMGCMKGSSGLPECRTENDNFSGKIGEFVADVTRSVTDSNLSLGISDCFVKCWNSCSCVGFSSSNDNGTGCVFWNGMNRFSPNPHENSTLIYVISSQNQIQNQTQNQTQNPINPSIGNKTKNGLKLIWVITGISIPLVILCFGLLWCLKKKKHRREEEERRERSDENFLELTASEGFEVHQLGNKDGKGNDLSAFSFASIMDATEEFSSLNKLGQGGFGPVYKGRLKDGQEIAIKRLSTTSNQGLVEFKNELILIAKLQHTNLVRVLGYCIHGVEKMLIYEYMPNKSLDCFLFDEKKKAELDWPTRVKIIEGIAQGLLYLHKYSRMRVIHRDLKASNILLDESMNPKISDFGMARIFKQNEAEAITSRVVGTLGYMSPEYVMGGTFSVKSDIFSFGVLVMEIVTGRRNSSFARLDHRTFNLIGYAWELWQQGDALELKDPTIGSSCVEHQFLRTLHVALLCVQDSAMDRPITSDMISMLLNDTISLPTPNKPPYAMVRVESTSTSNEPKDLSVNNMSITVTDGR